MLKEENNVLRDKATKEAERRQSIRELSAKRARLTHDIDMQLAAQMADESDLPLAIQPASALLAIEPNREKNDRSSRIVDCDNNLRMKQKIKNLKQQLEEQTKAKTIAENEVSTVLTNTFLTRFRWKNSRQAPFQTIK